MYGSPRRALEHPAYHVGRRYQISIVEILDFVEYSSPNNIKEIAILTKFSTGDVVQLKSGGPDMTVEAVNSFNEVICVYFDYNGNVHREKFFRHEVLIYPSRKADPRQQAFSLSEDDD